MLNELLIKAIENKNILLSQSQKLYENISEDYIASKWTNCNFTKKDPTTEVIAVDGSINSENFITETLYAISSHAIYSPIKPGTEFLSNINNIEIMLNSIDSYNSIFAKQMNIFELKTILNSLYTKPNVDYLFLDGDFFSILNHVASIVNTSIRQNKFIKDYTQQIVENEKDNFSLEVPTIHSFIEDIPQNLNIASNDVILYFQMIEQLCILKNILNHYSNKIVSISKTSRTKILYEDENFSDLGLITKFIKNTGYSDAMPIEDTRFRAYINHTIQYGQYPIYNDFFKNLYFTNRFVRLTDKGSVLKVQLAYNATEEEFKKVFEDLHSHSLKTSGYPVLLKKVHEDVKITNSDMKKILKQLDKSFELKERNVV